MGVEFASLPAHKLFQIEVELPLKIPSPTDLELVSWAIKAKAWALRPAGRRAYRLSKHVRDGSACRPMWGTAGDRVGPKVLDRSFEALLPTANGSLTYVCLDSGRLALPSRTSEVSVRDPSRVVDEGQEQILPDIAHGRLGKPARANDSHQIAFQQGDAGAFDCNIGASSQCNPDFGGRERRSVNEVG
jgi:hypothetical protein